MAAIPLADANIMLRGERRWDQQGVPVDCQGFPARQLSRTGSGLLGVHTGQARRGTAQGRTICLESTDYRLKTRWAPFAVSYVVMLRGVCGFGRLSWQNANEPLPIVEPKLDRRGGRLFLMASGLPTCLDQTHSFTRRVFLCSRLPTHVVQLPGVKHPGVRSLLRCALPVASAYRCSWICRLAAFRSSLVRLKLSIKRCRRGSYFAPIS